MAQGPWAKPNWDPEEETKAARFTDALPRFAQEPLRIFGAAMEAELNLRSGEALALIRRLFATCRWRADMSAPLWDFEVPMARIAFDVSDAGRALG